MGIIQNPTLQAYFYKEWVCWDENTKILQCCLDSINLHYFLNTVFLGFKIPIFLEFTAVLVKLAHLGWGYLNEIMFIILKKI
jgi:hypothetical protein